MIRLASILVPGLSALCLGTLSPSAPAQAPTSADRPAAAPFAVRNVRLFDGRHVVRKTTILVDGGVIAAIGPNLDVPVGTEIIEGSGYTLLPGLIDSHVHYVSPRNVQQALSFGITTALDMGTDPRWIAEARARRAGGEIATDLFSAGALVTAPGGHGTEYGLKISTLASPGEAARFVDARVAAGSDYIKIVYDDGRTYKPIPTLSRETLAATIDAAHRRGKKAIVHIGSSEEAMTSISLGADGIAHLFVDAPPAPDFARMARARGAFAVPTLVVLERVVRDFDRSSLLKDERLRPYMSPYDLASLRRSFPIRSVPTVRMAYAVDAVRQLKKAKVPILAGSDSAATQGPLLHRELELLVSAGLRPVEALAAATSSPARLFGLADRGEIRPGARADLLLVKGDPSKDVRALRSIARVWKDGRPFDRAGFSLSLAKEWMADEQLRKAPPPPGSEAGLVSDFDGNELSAAFGAGWSASTDKVAGGASVAELKIVPGGAEGSPYALQVEGEIRPGFPFGFAGASFSPGTKAGAPANLAGKRLSFWARGDGKSYGVMISARSYGALPVTMPFDAPPRWTHYSFPLSQFDGMEGHDVTSILFAKGPGLGTFSLQLDDVRLE